MSLVKGVQMSLEAMALSIKPGGSIGTLEVSGHITTSGDNLATVELDGPIDKAIVYGGIHALGAGSVAVRAPELPDSFANVDIEPRYTPDAD